jgi:BCL2-associated athanogene 2
MDNMENIAQQSSKDGLVDLLDQIEIHVEQLRKDAARLADEKDTLLTTLDTLKNNDILHNLEGGK